MKYHRGTLKLKKCKWFQDRFEFVGTDVAKGGKKPAQPKIYAFNNIYKPNKWLYMQIIIGIIGLYRQFSPFMSCKFDIGDIPYKTSPPRKTISNWKTDLMQIL